MRRLAICAAAFCTASALCVYLLPPAWIPFAALTAAFGLLFRKRRLRLFCAALAVGLLFCLLYDAWLAKPAAQLSGSLRKVTFELTDYPETTKYGICAVARLPEESVRGDVLLYLSDVPTETLKPGDRVSVYAEFAAADTLEGDNALYFRAQGVTLLAYARSLPTVTACARIPLRYLPRAAARYLSQTVARIFPQDVAPFLQSLLFGDRSNLDDATQTALSVSGVAHVIAISGMHVSILSAVLLWLLRGHGRRAALLCIPLALFFAVLTGGSASVRRASIMLAILLLAPVFGREYDPITSLSAAALLILLKNPWTIADVGFQLSFSAVLGIFLFTKRLYHALLRPKWLQAAARRKYFGRILRSVLASVATSIGAMLLTTPLTALHFGMVSVSGLLTNVLVLWAVSLTFSLGMGLGLLALLLPKLAALLAWPLAWLPRYVLAVIRFLARLPYAAVYTQNVRILLWLVLAYALLALTLVTRGEKRAAIPLSCMGIGLIAALFFTRLAAQTCEFRISVLDVGQGQCVLLECGSFTAMVDCGGSDATAAGNTAAQYLNAVGRDELDVLIVTHYDLDHMGGVAQLLSRVPVACVLLPDVDAGTENRRAVEAAARERGVPLSYVTQDTCFTAGDAALTVFASVSGAGGNDSCLSALFTQADFDLLITGDLDAAGEYRLMTSHALPDIEVLIAGHHGAKTSTSAAFLEETKPEIVLISVGKNRYGHPADAVLARIEASGAAAYRTDVCGNIIIRR